MTGNVIGPLMGYEVLSAFFLEAGFLGVMIFGINRVGKYPHLFATAMVSLGTLVSMFWIPPPIAGCTRPQATPCRTENSSSWTGGR